MSPVCGGVRVGQDASSLEAGIPCGTRGPRVLARPVEVAQEVRVVVGAPRARRRAGGAAGGGAATPRRWMRAGDQVDGKPRRAPPRAGTSAPLQCRRPVVTRLRWNGEGVRRSTPACGSCCSWPRWASSLGVWLLRRPAPCRCCGRVVIAFALSGIGSYFLLNRPREAFAPRVEERAGAARRPAFEETPAREDADEPTSRGQRRRRCSSWRSMRRSGWPSTFASSGTRTCQTTTAATTMSRIQNHAATSSRQAQPAAATSARSDQHRPDQLGEPGLLQHRHQRRAGRAAEHGARRRAAPATRKPSPTSAHHVVATATATTAAAAASTSSR